MPGCASQASECDLCFYSLLGLRLWEERVRSFDLQFLRQHLKGQYIKISNLDLFNSTILPSYWLQCRYFQSFPPNRLCTGWCWDFSPRVYSVYMRRRLMTVSVVSMTYCRDFLLFPMVFPNTTLSPLVRILSESRAGLRGWQLNLAFLRTDEVMPFFFYRVFWPSSGVQIF